jgi:hypothetical protein
MFRTLVRVYFHEMDLSYYIFLSFEGLTVYLKDREKDPTGEVQSSMPWKTRTVICNENERRTFSYIELDEHDSIKLEKKNGKKLLYNNHLCQLEFKIKFEVRFSFFLSHTIYIVLIDK